MYECVGLVKKNLSYFKKLNDKRTLFNPLNKDFFENYYNYNFAKQILMRRKIKLIKSNLNYIGYIWTDIIDKKICYINSMNIISSSDKDYSSYKYLINFVKKNLHMIYMCQKKNNNFEILTSIGFNKKEGTLIFNMELHNDISTIIKNNINFHVLKRGVDEQIRCDIQNKVFEDEGRIPLTLEDIYYDELQNYYYDNGAIFIKKDKEYIGYGQIIIENKTTPVVVNFGINAGKNEINAGADSKILC